MRVLSVILIPAAIAGVLIGVGTYTFVYAKGYSYLTNDLGVCQLSTSTSRPADIPIRFR